MVYMYMYMYTLIDYGYRYSYILCVGPQWVAVTLLLSVCSVLCKEQGITVVAVCFTLDIFLVLKVQRSNSVSVEHVPYDSRCLF